TRKRRATAALLHLCGRRSCSRVAGAGLAVDRGILGNWTGAARTDCDLGHWTHDSRLHELGRGPHPAHRDARETRTQTPALSGVAGTYRNGPTALGLTMRIRQRFSKFTAIGALGFLTDAGLFALMGGVGASPWVARAVSATTAITLTWALNRRFTFSDRQSHARIAEYSRY